VTLGRGRPEICWAQQIMDADKWIIYPEKG